jgi:hypothetical protein
MLFTKHYATGQIKDERGGHIARIEEMKNAWK